MAVNSAPRSGSGTSGADAAEGRGGRHEEGMGGLAKGLRVLEGFDASRPRMTISDAARYAGLSPAAARRCLLTLRDAGYLSHDGKYFQPTPRMVRLGRGFADTSPWVSRAQTYLESARDVLDESVSIAVLDNGQCLFVARAVGPQIVTMNIAVGARVPVHASATGRVLLAGLADESVEDFFAQHPPVRLTSRTVTDVGVLLGAVRSARQRGYATSSEELELGLNSLAVPIIDSRGVYVAAVSVSAFTGHYDIETLLSKSLPVLSQVAQDIGKML